MSERFDGKAALVDGLWLVAAMSWLFAWMLFTGLLGAVSTFTIVTPSARLTAPDWLQAFTSGLVWTVPVWLSWRWPRLRRALVASLVAGSLLSVMGGAVSTLDTAVTWFDWSLRVDLGAAVASGLGVIAGLGIWFSVHRAVDPHVSRILEA